MAIGTRNAGEQHGEGVTETDKESSCHIVLADGLAGGGRMDG